MIHCERAQNLFGPAWDDALSVTEREGLEAHFAQCPACQKGYDEFARTLELVQALPRPQVADDFAERVLRTARARELEIALARERRPAVFGLFGGRLAVAAALAVAVGAGALALSRPHGAAPIAARSPQVAAVTHAAPSTARTAATVTPQLAAVTHPTTSIGDPDGPIVAATPHGTTAAHAAPVHHAASGQALAAMPDSLFDHSADIEFVLDPVKIRRERGRGYTPVTSSVRGQTASITF